MTTLLVLIFGFFLFEAVVFASHRLMHARWTGPLWRSHQTHHQLYNPRHPETMKFQPVGWRSFRFRAIIFVIAVSLIFTLFPLALAIPLFVEMAILSAITDYLHDATHTMEHPLERYRWYRILKRKHWTHHANTKRNFGIMTFIFDRIARTHQKG